VYNGKKYLKAEEFIQNAIDKRVSKFERSYKLEKIAKENTGA